MIAGLTIVSVIVVGISGLIYRSISQLIASSGWVAHSYQVIDALDLTEDYFTDAQSAERGYVATCNMALVSPFRRDIPMVYSRIAVLQSLTVDNPVQQRRVEALTKALNDELGRMSNIVATNLRGDLKSAEGMLADDTNTSATREIHSTIEAMEREERRLLKDRLHAVNSFATLTVVASITGTLSCFGILAFVFWLIRREARRRAETEFSLQDANCKLEQSLDELKQFNASARTVSLLGELLQTCRSTKEALSIAAAHLATVIPDATGTIGLFSNSRDVIESIQSIGTDETAHILDFPPDACWGLRRGRGHLYEAGGPEPFCEHLRVHAQTSLCIPLSAQGETLGVLSIGVARAFTAIERQTIQTIAEQLALAVANLKLQETLRFQSVRDQLTGLFNRRYLDDALAREIARSKRHGRPVAIVMIDVDHFKRYNDTHGHEGGDALLSAFGKLLATMARGEDFACRYGGEEFCLVMPGADTVSAASRADELREAVKRLNVSLQGRPLGQVTMSAGVAAFPCDGANGENVIAQADRALYRAKENGRDRVVTAANLGSIASRAAASI